MKVTIQAPIKGKLDEAIDQVVDKAIRQCAEDLKKEMDEYAAEAAARCYCAWFERTYGFKSLWDSVSTSNPTKTPPSSHKLA